MMNPILIEILKMVGMAVAVAGVALLIAHIAALWKNRR
jgi:hypothetical protein